MAPLRRRRRRTGVLALGVWGLLTVACSRKDDDGDRITVTIDNYQVTQDPVESLTLDLERKISELDERLAKLDDLEQMVGALTNPADIPTEAAIDAPPAPKPAPAPPQEAPR